ncbi:MAG: histidine kinase [Psychroserpens sp.]|uniref:sensor histidine kinase n=1 Tax=Psychroserpens sp. TaxID=2020870 RepID=UPI003C71B92A
MYYIRFLVCAQTEQAINEEQIALIAYVIFAVLLLSVMSILFFVTFQKRKNQLLLKQVEQQKAFDDEITRTQTEIQEQTLKYVGWELHDNVGQLLAYANMQLNMLKTNVEPQLKPKVEETTQIVKDSLEQVRALSKSLNNEVLLNMGLEASITNELSRLKRMKFASADLQIIGESKALPDQKHEIIIFRMLQEFLSNTVKYSEANEIKVILNYKEDELIITASDDGVGFDIASAEKGSGLINIESRANLIGAKAIISSQPEQGVILTIDYPFHRPEIN